MHPYHARRATLQTSLAPGILVYPAARECIRNHDSHYPYRFDSHFYYLTGFTEPEAILVQVIGAAPCTMLFCRDKQPEREVWDGVRYGPHEACERFAFDKAYSIATFDQEIISLLQNQTRLYFPLGQDSAWDQRILSALNKARAATRHGATVPTEIIDINAIVGEMRLYKDPDEISLLRQAALITTQAHCRAMRTTQPGLYEYSIEAEILHTFYQQGSRFPAYPSIVAAGGNACTLHYVENTAQLTAGDLLLVDAGCELAGYASDVTRTFPINGKFTTVQRDVYEIVLAAQLAAINEMQPGNRCNKPHDAALRVLAQGLIDLGLCQGSVEGVIESGAYRQFYMHRIGHWLGLDVHDTGRYHQDNEWRPLEAGMVMTIEPGLYIRPASNVPPHLANIGIRIEDDILITADGHENLTAAAPKTVADIEALMQASE